MTSGNYLPRTPKRSGTSLLKYGLWILFCLRGAKGQLCAGCIFRMCCLFVQLRCSHLSARVLPRCTHLLAEYVCMRCLFVQLRCTHHPPFGRVCVHVLFVRTAKMLPSFGSCTAKMHPSFGRVCVHVLFVRTAKMLPSFGSCAAKMHPPFGRVCVHVLFVRTAKMLPSFGSCTIISVIQIRRVLKSWSSEQVSAKIVLSAI